MHALREFRNPIEKSTLPLTTTTCPEGQKWHFTVCQSGVYQPGTQTASIGITEILMSIHHFQVLKLPRTFSLYLHLSFEFGFQL